MKRKLICILLVLVFTGSMYLSAYASESQAPQIVDNADLLTPDEEFDLELTAQYLRDVYEMDVVILTEDTIGGQSPRTYAENYYDSNGYGLGANGDGVLLLIVMDTRDWYISTCGAAVRAIPNHMVDSLADGMLGYLSEGTYYDAFDTWLQDLEVYYDDYRTESSSDSGDGDVLTGLIVGILPISLGIGLVVGGIVLLILRGMMNNKLPQNSAGDYLIGRGANFRVQRDIFLYSHVSKTPKPKNTSSGGGGGRSHGGGGGKF